MCSALLLCLKWLQKYLPPFIRLNILEQTVLVLIKVNNKYSPSKLKAFERFNGTATEENSLKYNVETLIEVLTNTISMKCLLTEFIRIADTVFVLYGVVFPIHQIQNRSLVEVY